MSTETKSPEAAAVKPQFRVLKIGQCPSLSGKSTLTYHIGCDAQSAIHIRVFANTASGYFSQEWVPFAVIQGEFDKIPTGETITSFLLHGLFLGKSVNTPSFLFAVLKNEGLVEAAKDKQRQYERKDPATFLAGVQALIASGVELKWEEPAKTKAKDAKASAALPKGNAKSAKGEAKAPPGDAKGATSATKPVIVNAKQSEQTTTIEAKPSTVTATPAIEVPTFITPKTDAKTKPATTTAMPGKKSKAKAKD